VVSKSLLDDTREVRKRQVSGKPKIVFKREKLKKRIFKKRKTEFSTAPPRGGIERIRRGLEVIFDVSHH